MNDKQRSFCHVVENAILHSILHPDVYVTVMVDDSQHSQYIASDRPRYKEYMAHAINIGYKTVFDVHGGRIEV